MSELEQPSNQQWAAVRRFAKKHGVGWKEKLLNAWLTGADEKEPKPDCYLLRQVRNQFGPAWLEKLGSKYGT